MQWRTNTRAAHLQTVSQPSQSANRVPALAKRKALIESSNQQHQNDHWKLFKCRKLYHELAPTTPDVSFPNQPLKLVQIDPNSETHLSERFWVKLEICSPDSFSVTPLAVQGLSGRGGLLAESKRLLAQCKLVSA